MIQRKFTWGLQRSFAELSGDYNPLHTDAKVARRLLFGGVVVHGIHALLWALDSWLRSKPASIEILSINAMFNKPIRVDEEVTFTLTDEKEGRARINLQAGESLCTLIDVVWSHSRRKAWPEFSTHHPDRRVCRTVSLDEVESASGALPLYFHQNSATELFPHLVTIMPSKQLAGIIASSRLVGVECPGLHSLYSELQIAFDSLVDSASELHYEVQHFDRRFSLVSIRIAAPGMSGLIKAFLRPGPQAQVNSSELPTLVSRTEFQGQRALIIGGSRGLGEATAKLLSAGGADVKITYFAGKEDASRVTSEILSSGGSAASFFFDVLDPGQDLYQKLGTAWSPTHLYYFATPFIFAGDRGFLSLELLKKFCDYYLQGFLNTVKHVARFNLKRVFYPSSVAIDEIPIEMGEYVIAKMAGETLCIVLEKKSPGLRIYRPRLPRLSTDQTATPFPVKNFDPVNVLLPHLRSFNSL